MKLNGPKFSEFQEPHPTSDNELILKLRIYLYKTRMKNLMKLKIPLKRGDQGERQLRDHDPNFEIF